MLTSPPQGLVCVEAALQSQREHLVAGLWQSSWRFWSFCLLSQGLFQPLLCWGQTGLLCPSHVAIKGNEATDKTASAKPLSNGPCDENMYSTRTTSLSLDVGNIIYGLRFYLRKIRDTTRPYYSSSLYGTKTSIVLSRLRIGYTLLAHGFFDGPITTSICLSVPRSSNE